MCTGLRLVAQNNDGRRAEASVGKHTSAVFSAQFPGLFCSCAPFRARTFTIRIRRHRLVGSVDRATPRHRSMASESDSETLPLLQGHAAARSGRRASRVLAAAAAATLVALSALALTSSDRPACGAAHRIPVQGRKCAPGRHLRNVRLVVQGLLRRLRRVAHVVVQLPGQEPSLQRHVDGPQVDVPNRYRCLHRHQRRC